jgi:serine protease Do
MKIRFTKCLAIALVLPPYAETRAQDNPLQTLRLSYSQQQSQQGQSQAQQQRRQNAPQSRQQHQQGNQAQQQPTQAQGNLYTHGYTLQNQYLHSAPQDHQSINLWSPAGNNVIWYDLADQTAGMSLTPADEALRAHLKLPKDQGLIVTSLDLQSPAAQAGIQQNDILLDLENNALGKPDDLEEGLKAAGDKPAPLTILRGGKRLTLQVQPRVRVTMGPVQPEPPAYWIGVSVSGIEPALRSQLKLPQNQGLLVIEVMKDSPASKAGIKVHDILLSVAGKPLDSQEKLVEVVQGKGEAPVPVELVREGTTQTIEVTPQRRKSAEFKAFGRHAPYHYYQFFRPGGVVTWDPEGKGRSETFYFENQLSQQKSAQGAGSASTKRLDEIDAEIKQLRKAIEELSKSIKDKQ